MEFSRWNWSLVGEVLSRAFLSEIDFGRRGLELVIILKYKSVAVVLTSDDYWDMS